MLCCWPSTGSPSAPVNSVGGATAGEEAAVLPGDDLIHAPTFWATRAITINAPPEEIWPWILQIGYHRAGFYGYDLIENIGSRSGVRSAERIISEVQNLKPGDRIYLSAVAWLTVHTLIPNRILIWVGNENPANGAFTWALKPLNPQQTRVIFRIRFRYHWDDWLLLPLDLFTDVADHVAVPAMLDGLKTRVERRPIPSLAWQFLEILLWLVSIAFFGVALILVFRRRWWWRPLIAAALSATTILFLFYAHSPLWLEALAVIAALAVLHWSARA